MIYGNKWLSLVKESKDEYSIESIVYDEYLNRKSLLETCTDEAAKPILEAQVEVLREVSIKDIINKIKEALNKFINFIKNIVTGAVDKIKEIINNAKAKKIKNQLDNIVNNKTDIKTNKTEDKTNESSLFMEDGEREQDPYMPVYAYPNVYFTVDGETCNIDNFYSKTINAVNTGSGADKFTNYSNLQEYITGRKSISDEPIYNNEKVSSVIEKHKKLRFIIAPKDDNDSPSKETIREIAKVYKDCIKKDEDLFSHMNKEYVKYYKDENSIKTAFERDVNNIHDLDNSNINANAYSSTCSQYIRLNKEIGSYYYYVLNFATESYGKLLRKAAMFSNAYGTSATAD